MSQQEHLASLRAEHQELEAQIDEEMQKLVPDDIRIQELKRQKLRIKDEMAVLSSAAAK